VDSIPFPERTNLSSKSFSMRIAKRTSLSVIPGDRGVSGGDLAGAAFEVFSVKVNVVNVNRTPIGWCFSCAHIPCKPITSLKNSSVYRYLVNANFFSKATTSTSRALLCDVWTFQ